MAGIYELIIIIIVIILVLYFTGVLCLKKENYDAYNKNFYDSMLEKDMDYIKNNKGLTLDDYILYNNAIYGSPIESPIR